MKYSVKTFFSFWYIVIHSPQSLPISSVCDTKHNLQLTLLIIDITPTLFLAHLERFFRPIFHEHNQARSEQTFITRGNVHSSRPSWTATGQSAGEAVHRNRSRIRASLAVCSHPTISKQIDLFHIINELCCSSTCQAWPARVNNERKLDVSGSRLSDSAVLTIQYIRTNVSCL